MPPKPCAACGSSYSGHGNICGPCRRRGSKSVQCCPSCQEFFAGNGAECSDCIAKKPVERWKLVTCQAYTPTQAQAGSPGMVRAWTFQGWLKSLDSSTALAQCVAQHVCPEGRLDEGFMVKFLQNMPQDLGTVEELLRECGALTALAAAFMQGALDLTEASASSGAELSEKFRQQADSFEMSYGTLADFFGGLEKLIGAPDPKLRSAMEREHCSMQDSDTEFVTTNYAVKTTPRAEWLFATGGPAPPGGWPPETKNCKPEHRRQPKSPEWLLEEMGKLNAILKQHSEPELKEEEAIGLRLYTGPMFQKYNTILRAIAHKQQLEKVEEDLDRLDKIPSMSNQEKEKYRQKQELLKQLEAGMTRFEEVLRNPNTYTTTMHVINSGLVKLGKIQKAEKVYRGLSGGLLPKEFWVPNIWGVCGGVEHGFMSTTSDRAVALDYAAADPDKAGTVLELQMSMVDRGANLQWVSQYPHEAELCFAPLTGIQVLSTRVEKSVLVVEARLSVNLVSLTIEEVVAKRHKMVSRLCTELCDEVHDKVMKAEGEWQAVEAALVHKDSSGHSLWHDSVKNLRNAMSACMVEEVTSGSPQEMNDNEKFLDAVRKAVDVKSKFERPTVEAIVSLLHPAMTTLDHTCRDVMRLAVRRVDQWTPLPNLLQLDVSGTELTDASVKELAERCPKLRLIDLSDCTALTDNAAVFLADGCKHLQHTDFFGCVNLTDNTARTLADGCKGLQRANFARCESLTDNAVKYLAEGCSDLERAEFADCTRLTDAAAKYLADGCSKLQHVDFSRCVSLTDAGVRCLAIACKGLLHTGFAECRNLTDDALRYLGQGCGGLQFADFSGCEKVTDKGVAHLAQSCKELQHADFSRCALLTDDAAKSVADGWKSLQRAQFSGCDNLTNNAVKHLSHGCRGLLHADFSYCKGVSDQAARYLADGCKGLLHANFAGCARTDNAAKYLAEGCKKLQHASFAHCENITDNTPKYLAEGCKQLQHTDFTACWHLTDKSVRYLSEACKDLQHADFSGCQRLTDHAVKDLAEGCKSLQHAAFARCKLLTDDAAKYLAEGCPDLQHVDFSRCERLTDGAARYLAESCRNLRHANFSGCEELTEAAAKSLAQGCQNLRFAGFAECRGLTENAVKFLREAVPDCKVSL